MIFQAMIRIRNTTSTSPSAVVTFGTSTHPLALSMQVIPSTGQVIAVVMGGAIATSAKVPADNDWHVVGIIYASQATIGWATQVGAVLTYVDIQPYVISLTVPAMSTGIGCLVIGQAPSAPCSLATGFQQYSSSAAWYNDIGQVLSYTCARWCIVLLAPA